MTPNYVTNDEWSLRLRVIKHRQLHYIDLNFLIFMKLKQYNLRHGGSVFSENKITNTDTIMYSLFYILQALLLIFTNYYY